MSSRHTPIKGSLTRSFGIEEDQDLVVELNEEGYVAVRYEPTHRRLKRGEKLPESRISVEDLWKLRYKPAISNAKVNEVEAILKRILSRVPIADFGVSEIVDKANFKIQAWLWQQLKNEIDGVQ